MHKRVWNMLLSLCLAAALLCSTCAFAADTADEEQPANSVVLSDGEEPENGTVPPEGDEPDDGTVSPDGDEPDDGTVPSDGEEPHEHDYVVGKCACGDVLSEYQWYYSNTGTAYTISTGAEMAALADVVNSGVDLFVQKIINLTADVTLPTDVTWSPIGGETTKIELFITSQEELDAAIAEYKLIYDNEGNSYTGGTSTYHHDLAYGEGGDQFYRVVAGIFSGTFNGNHHTISGLNVESDMGYVGLFGNVDGTLLDFTVNGTVTYTGDNGDYIGGVAGMLSMGGIISGVTSNVTVVAMSGYNVGGIVGFVGTPLSVASAGNTFVTMCINNGTVYGYQKVGGIAGENAGVIKLCVNNGTVNGLNSSSKNGVGGIVGRNGNNNAAIEAGTVSSCYNTGNINAFSATFGSPKWSGGIAGFNDALSTVENCYVTIGPNNSTSYNNPIVGNNESKLGGNNYTLRTNNTIFSGTTESEVGILVTSDQLKTLAGALGGAYRSSPTGGYPELLWMMESNVITFSVTPAEVEYAIKVVDSLGVPVAPESDGSYLLVDGETYTYTVSAAGYEDFTGSHKVTDDETIGVSLKAHVFTLNNMTGTTSPAAITDLTSDETTGSVTFHVSCDLACAVAYTADGGVTYTRLTATANDNGGYDFAIHGLTANIEIVVVIKGDANGDGMLTNADVSRTKGASLGKIELSSLEKLTADVNEDNSLTNADVTRLKAVYLEKAALNW